MVGRRVARAAPEPRPPKRAARQPEGPTAGKANQRLSAFTYLAGPRVFGFTGVYRPFSRYAKVLDAEGLPAANAERLIHAWERDQDLPGFISGDAASQGMRIRREIEKNCLSALSAARVTASRGGWLMEQLAESLAPREAGRHERAALRHLVATGEHQIRNELTALLARALPPPDASQLEIARALAAQASPGTRLALTAAIEFEGCATAIEYAFRRLLAYATSLGGLFSVRRGTEAPQLSDLAGRVGILAKRAVDAVAELDESLTHEIVDCFAYFNHAMTASEFVDMLIARHQQVQEAKNKRMWIDPIKGKWIVRPPYRNQSDELVDEIWTHPMRLHTLVSFLRATT